MFVLLLVFSLGFVLVLNLVSYFPLILFLLLNPVLNFSVVVVIPLNLVILVFVHLNLVLNIERVLHIVVLNVKISFSCFFLASGEDPLKLTLGVSTDISGVPIKGKDYTDDLADLIKRTSGEVSEMSVVAIEL